MASAKAKKEAAAATAASPKAKAKAKAVPVDPAAAIDALIIRVGTGNKASDARIALRELDADSCGASSLDRIR